MNAQTLTIADLRPGDVLLYHGHEILSEIIDDFERASYSHASICFKNIDTVYVAEAISGGLEPNTIDVSITGCQIMVLRPQFEVNDTLLSRFTIANLGKHRYGFFRLIVAQAIYQLSGKKWWILADNPNEHPKRFICGEWVTYDYYHYFYDNFKDGSEWLKYFTNWPEATPASVLALPCFDHYMLKVK